MVIVARGGAGFATAWLLGAHALFALLLLLFHRLDAGARVGGVLYDLYPLLLVLGLYSELGVLAAGSGAGVFPHDAVVQRWEAAVFGQQISYTWIRNSPSVFWSFVLHLAYLSYYPILAVGPVLLLARRRRDAVRRVVFAVMAAFVACYVVFLLFPVAGPNYVFPEPTGAVRQVWSARIVYATLGSASAIGTAFPSSHVAATVAVVLTLWREWRVLAALLVVPAALLIVGTVYCQMHYGVDVLAGLAVGLAVSWVSSKVSA